MFVDGDREMQRPIANVDDHRLLGRRNKKQRRRRTKRGRSGVALHRATRDTKISRV